MSRTFRQSGLSSGAKLELVVASRSPSVVSVALQLPEPDAKAAPGGRLTDKFPSDTTLWLILRKFETSGSSNLNFTARGIAQTATAGASGAGRIFYETPVLNIMGRELSSFTDLQKTLAQLGLNSGSSLIRLGFKRTETPLEEAMVEIGEYFKSIEEPKEPGVASEVADLSSSGNEGESVLDSIPGESNPGSLSAMDVDTPVITTGDEIAPEKSSPVAANEAPAAEEVVVGPNQRPIHVFAAPSSETPKAAQTPFNESDYEPTVAHAKLHQSRLLSRSHNVRLLSDAEEAAKAEEKAAKQSSVKEVSIKVRFPDQLTIVSSFTILDTGSTLYEFVNGVIVAEDQPFTLVWTSPKGPLTVPKDSKRLIADLGFGGRMLVNFNWAEGANSNARSGTTLKLQYAGKAKEIQVQEIVNAREEATTGSSKTEDKGKATEGGEKKKTGGVPKWLKLPGKK
jgi:tether containing UBX domain for GLUT4